MKILAIRGRNLASLAGEFEFELDAPPLKDEGLFAITGPTGSSKSTLLDALCLALYGDIPRLPAGHGVETADGNHEVKTNDPRTILRRGTGAGFAEVDFIASDGRRCRSRWEVRRARGKPDGRLQQASVSLVDQDSGKTLAGATREHRAAVEKLLGLSFDQFRRSVLLAQGDFAAFLKVRPTNGRNCWNASPAPRSMPSCPWSPISARRQKSRPWMTCSGSWVTWNYWTRGAPGTARSGAGKGPGNRTDRNPGESAGSGAALVPAARKAGDGAGRGNGGEMDTATESRGTGRNPRDAGCAPVPLRPAARLPPLAGTGAGDPLPAR